MSRQFKVQVQLCVRERERERERREKNECVCVQLRYSTCILPVPASCIFFPLICKSPIKGVTSLPTKVISLSILQTFHHQHQFLPDLPLDLEIVLGPWDPPSPTKTPWQSLSSLVSLSTSEHRTSTASSLEPVYESSDGDMHPSMDSLSCSYSSFSINLFSSLSMSLLGAIDWSGPLLLGAVALYP